MAQRCTLDLWQETTTAEPVGLMATPARKGRGWREVETSPPIPLSINGEGVFKGETSLVCRERCERRKRMALALLAAKTVS